MISFFFVALPIIIAAAAICLAIIHFTKPDGHQVTFNTVFSTYFYAISITSLLAIFVGASAVGTALLSDAFGRDFSYESHASYYGVDTPASSSVEGTDLKEADITAEQVAEATQQEKDRIEQQYREDIFNGVSLLVIGLLFFVTHTIGWRIVDQTKPKPSYLYKAHLFAQLAIYSLATIVALPLAVSQLLRFYLQTDTANLYSSIAAPGQAVAAALITTPLWIYFIWKTIALSKLSTQT